MRLTKLVFSIYLGLCSLSGFAATEITGKTTSGVDCTFEIQKKQNSYDIRLVENHRFERYLGQELHRLSPIKFLGISAPGVFQRSVDGRKVILLTTLGKPSSLEIRTTNDDLLSVCKFGSL